ncbi:UNVERIFIED_ORG: enamine deaminase RidA (YjgF/YER057c/UK114 family) [Arthrobacter globiformis]|nr:enamine deaminase RidA (YjgF/YER057c/UK114 family) [Arthrobacter globiformis]
MVGYQADRTLDETFEEQVHVTFENLVALLKSSGASLKDAWCR